MRRVFIASEGDSEYLALPKIIPNVRATPPIISTGVVRVPCHPEGPIDHIVRVALPSLKLAQAKRADLYVLILDREQRPEAPGALASVLEDALKGGADWPFDIQVVIKDRALENWLVADLNALRMQRARFTVTGAMARQVEPNKADRVNALRLLHSATNGRTYDKKVDGRNIAERLNVDDAALHSRSFRHFLHVLRHAKYEDQCRRPAD